MVAALAADAATVKTYMLGRSQEVVHNIDAHKSGQRELERERSIEQSWAATLSRFLSRVRSTARDTKTARPGYWRPKPS
eukprot:COSAG05_NODE_176_length_14928_cov_75.109717_14_plen_79_part_00